MEVVVCWVERNKNKRRKKNCRDEKWSGCVAVSNKWSLISRISAPNTRGGRKAEAVTPPPGGGVCIECFSPSRSPSPLSSPTLPFPLIINKPKRMCCIHNAPNNPLILYHKFTFLLEKKFSKLKNRGGFVLLPLMVIKNDRR